MSHQINVIVGENYRASDTGPMDQLDNHTFHISEGDEGINGKLFLNEPLKLTGMEVSLNKLPAGAGMPFYHRHTQQEELYIFVRGKGQFQIDGDSFNVTEGTAINVRPEGVRTWRNNSKEDLYYIVVQAKIGSIDGATISDGVVLEKKVEWPEK